MTRIVKGFTLLLFSLLSFTFLIGCTDDLVGIDAKSKSIVVEYGKTEQLEVEVTFKKEVKLLYKSNNDKVATVDKDGMVTAVGYGDATITVSIEQYPNVKVEIRVNVPQGEIVLQGEDRVYIGQEIILVGKDEEGGNGLVWESSNSLIAKVDQDGKVLGVAAGDVKIIVTSTITGDKKEKDIKVLMPKPETIEISIKSSKTILVLEEVKLTYNVLPKGAATKVNWLSSDEKIATVDSDGIVKTHSSGEVVITAVSVEDENVQGKITIVVEVDPISLIRNFHIDNPVHKKVKSNSATLKEDYIYGSVNLYWNADMNLVKQILPLEEELVDVDGVRTPNTYIGLPATQEIINAVEFRSIRSGVKMPEIKQIIYHDTGNNTEGAGALSHARFLGSTGNRSITYYGERKYGFRSWHFTVDHEMVIQHLPEDEVAFQGDTYEAYTTGIGIETSIAHKSDFFTTWHRTAKLISSLLIKYPHLSFDSIKQHNEMSGKDCPQVLRGTNLWDTAIDMVVAEYMVATELAGYTITYKSNNPDYVSDEGRIIKLDKEPKLVSYTVTIKNDKGYNQSTILFSTLPKSLV